MIDYYAKSIIRMKNSLNEIGELSFSRYQILSKKFFERELTDKEIQELPDSQLFDFYYELKKVVSEEKSTYSVQKLALAIQQSRSGIGGSTMTEFKCAFCEELDIWGNTAVPHICHTCATKMAQTIIHHNMNLLKS